MTALVVSISNNNNHHHHHHHHPSHGRFSTNTKEPYGPSKHSNQDHPVTTTTSRNGSEPSQIGKDSRAVDGMPRARYSLDDYMNDALEESSVESSIPSLNDDDVVVDMMEPTSEQMLTAVVAPAAVTIEERCGQSCLDPTSAVAATSALVGDDIPFVESEVVGVPVQASTPSYGGLMNLGNTCYMNSALQMLASIEGFTETIENVPPQVTSKLRDALLDVLKRLSRGETVRPDDFKQQIDELSPLFVGYFQQDSHEFLTTLLGLLDEDYKKTQKSEDQDEKDQQSNAMDECMTTATEQEEKSHKPMSIDEAATIKETLDVAASSISSKIGVSGKEDSTNSLLDLQFTDIENLLHGNKSSFGGQVSEGETASSDENDHHLEEQPKCKLIGGRMSMSGVVLTPLNEDRPVCGNTSESSAGAAARRTNVCSDNAGDSSSASTDRNQEQKPCSPVDSYFNTEVRVCLTCESCKYTRSHLETFYHLSLELGDGMEGNSMITDDDECGRSRVEDSLRKFFAPERREIKCEKCFCENALQTMEIKKLPRALLLHFKRFLVDVSPDYSSVTYRKNQSPVDFDEILNLDESGALAEVCAKDVSLPPNDSSQLDACSKFGYQIRSVVNHIGSSASCGHYTADAARLHHDYENCVVGSLRKWTRFNDSFVSSVSSEEAIEQSSRTAYMIMYELVADEK